MSCESVPLELQQDQLIGLPILHLSPLATDSGRPAVVGTLPVLFLAAPAPQLLGVLAVALHSVLPTVAR